MSRKCWQPCCSNWLSPVGHVVPGPEGGSLCRHEGRTGGGLVTFGYQDNGKPVNMKASGKAFGELVGLHNRASGYQGRGDPSHTEVAPLSRQGCER